MGGRGSQGGTRSTYRGDSTQLFRQQQNGGGINLPGGGSGGGGAGGGGGGGSTGTGSAGTGGIQTGGGSGGSGSGGSTTTTTTNQQTLPHDADLEAAFEQSDIFKDLEAKYAQGGANEGNPDGYEKAYNRAYDRWLKTVTIEEPEEPVEPFPNDPIEAIFGTNISEARKSNARFLMNKLPERHRQLLENRGVKLYVDDRADQTDGWADYAAETGIDSTSLTADGRELGDLSFYHKGRVFVSDASGHGSVNVYVHELSHAIDYHYLGKDENGVENEFHVEYPAGSGVERRFRYLSDDPEFVEMHRDRIATNTNILAYYRNGSNGSASSGRRESFAEGYASYVMGGREELKRLFKTYITADKFIAILKRQGVID